MPGLRRLRKLTGCRFTNSSRKSLVMKLYILDGESYYDRDYNLRRLDPPSYILEPRFELIGIPVKEPGLAAYWVEGPEATTFFASGPKLETLSGVKPGLSSKIASLIKLNDAPVTPARVPTLSVNKILAGGAS